MSAWRNAVDFHTPALTAVQYAVLSAIAGNANDDGLAFPAMTLIATKAHCADNNARRTIRQLEEAGYVKTVRRVRGNGSASSNLYQLSPVLLDCVPGCRCPIASRASAAQNDTPPTHSVGTPTQGVGAISKNLRTENGSSTRARARVLFNAKPEPGQDSTPSPSGVAENAGDAGGTGPISSSTALARPIGPENQRNAPGASSAVTDPSVLAEKVWRRAYLADPPPGLLAKKLRPLFEKHGPERILSAWDTYCHNTGAQFVNPDRFVSTWGSWEAGIPTKHNHAMSDDPLFAHRQVFGAPEGQ